MQNLNTTHQQEIIEDHRIYVPAGNGRTSFIDIRDIAAVACKALTETGHAHMAYDLTGSEAFTYGEVASLMSELWKVPIHYTNPKVADFKAYWKQKELPSDHDHDRDIFHSEDRFREKSNLRYGAAPWQEANHDEAIFAGL